MLPVLFTHELSNYNKYGICDTWSIRRDARNFFARSPDCPIIAHPPCRQFSRAKGLSKQDAGEYAMVIQTAEYVQRYGGVLEHPAYSKLFDWLPEPGAQSSSGFTVEVWQSWFGFPYRKRSWIYFSGCSVPYIPFTLSPAKPCKTVLQENWAERSLSTKEFCEWMIAAAMSHNYWSEYEKASNW